MLIKLFILSVKQKMRYTIWAQIIVPISYIIIFFILGCSLSEIFFPQITPDNGESLNIILVAISILLVPDYIIKLLFYRGSGNMNEFLSTKPIRQTSWINFLILENAINPWNLMLPAFFVPFCCISMTWFDAIMSFLVVYTASCLNGISNIAFHKTNVRIYKVSYFLVWFIFYVLFTMFNIYFGIIDRNFLFIPQIVENLLFSWIIYYMMNQEHTYIENRNHFPLLLNKENLTVSEYLKILRVKRILVPTIIMTMIFILQIYNKVLLDFGNNIFISIVAFCVIFPATIIGGYGLGIEANYFEGLWTKPILLDYLLKKKYYFYLTCCIIVSIFIYPLNIIGRISLLDYFTAVSFSLGIVVFSIIPTAYHSVRFEIYSDSFFDNQKFDTP